MKFINKNSNTKKLITLLLFTAAFGQAFAQLQLSKHSINSGGDVMNGGSYELKSSIGQIDSGTPSSNGNYTLNGGFLQQNTNLIFKNNF